MLKDPWSPITQLGHVIQEQPHNIMIYENIFHFQTRNTKLTGHKFTTNGFLTWTHWNITILHFVLPPFLLEIPAK